ncbi:MAG: UDP-4-amino-4,6-dideoxy-N-acetyl-beta-L-altrosamine transaminase [Burkholderiales bacterium]|nr:UDP-4-amino-4,6-dideoxy-N-acetyl-beta-L-altrosamine transaminase [Burkholderiales bacterium]
MIPYGRQDLSEEDIQAVVEILRADYITQGPAVPAFEESVAGYCGARHSVATNSATSALHLSCLALDVGPGDIVWTSPITFVASANCALYCGASIDFVDIDPLSCNMSTTRLEEKLEAAARTGKLPKVVIPVHLAGQSCDMAKIHELGRIYGFRIIEDASHAIGGKYRNEPVGNCRYSDITIFSFHPVKIVTTGEGGMALTNDPDLARALRLRRSHGITSDREEMSPRPCDEIWNYQQIDLGFNYRMTDIAAALGTSQMKRLEEFVARRNEIARFYDGALRNLPIVTQWLHPDCHSSHHLYLIRPKLQEIGKTHREIYQALHAEGILVNLHYIPVYLQPYFEKMGFSRGHCPEAERYYGEVLSIPMYYGLTRDQQEQVVAALQKVIGR